MLTDLGNGEVACAGTAADFAAAAAYLEARYPGGTTGARFGPVRGPVLNMGIRLITEVMDWAPVTLTQREHKVLIVLAEDSPDGAPGEVGEHGREKRVNWHSVESPVTLRRARVSRAEMYAVIATLIKKGCLERATKGGGGHEAKYRIPALRQEIPDAEASQLRQEIPDADPGELRQEIPDADPGELRLGKQDAASEPAPEAASGETRHSASGKNLSCVGDFQTPFPQSLGIPLLADVVAPGAEGDGKPAPSQSRKTAEITTAREDLAPDDQQIPPEVLLQSPAAGGNAREASRADPAANGNGRVAGDEQEPLSGDELAELHRIQARQARGNDPYKPEPRRGCPACGLDVAVMPGGALRVHGGRRNRCPGSRTYAGAAS